MNRKSVKTEKWLLSATAWQRKIAPAPEQINNTIEIFMRRNVEKSSGNDRVTDAFYRVIENNLMPHYKPDNIKNGILYVQCAPGPYSHQLKIMEKSIIETINTMCPRNKIRAVKAIIGKTK